LGGAADDAQVAAVGGGDLESVNEGVGAFLRDAAGGERIDDGGERELDGGAILRGRELEKRSVRDQLGLEIRLVAVELVAAMKFVVEVAEDGPIEGDAAALEAVGFDVTAEIDLHDVLLGTGNPPPGGWVS
jgi:hypothetical protein